MNFRINARRMLEEIEKNGAEDVPTTGLYLVSLGMAYPNGLSLKPKHWDRACHTTPLKLVDDIRRLEKLGIVTLEQPEANQIQILAK